MPIAAEEEIASSRLSLEEEIDRFRFVEDMGPSEKPVDISNSETKSINLSSVHPRQLIITWIDSESEKEEEQMDQNKRPGLKGLLANRNKKGKFKGGPQNATFRYSSFCSSYWSRPIGHAKFEEKEARSWTGGRRGSSSEGQQATKNGQGLGIRRVPL